TSQEQRTAITKKMSEANAKAVESVLKSEQVKRLRQIENQQAKTNMFSKEEVQKALKLTDDQKSTIQEINDDLQKDLRALPTGGQGGGGRPDPDAQKKREGLQKEAMDHIVKVLKDEQKSALKDLTGEPFELRLQGFGAGGAGGFPGGGAAGFGGFGA